MLPLSPLLIAGPTYFGYVCPRLQSIVVLDRGRGPYYGITWSRNEIYVLARNAGRGELIAVFDRYLTPVRIIALGRDVDGHQIHFSGDTLYATATRENAVARIEPRSGCISMWNWTECNTDINHINALAESDDSNYLWASHDNRKGVPSEVVMLSKSTGAICRKLTIDGPMNGTHNIERNIVASSGEESLLWDITVPECPKTVFTMGGAFFRGLGRFRDEHGEKWLLGSSPVLERYKRYSPNECLVHVIRDRTWDHDFSLTIPRIGQVFDLRSLASGYSHNGIPFPGDSPHQTCRERISTEVLLPSTLLHQ